jgi:hypothetical protein
MRATTTISIQIITVTSKALRASLQSTTEALKSIASSKGRGVFLSFSTCAAIGKNGQGSTKTADLTVPPSQTWGALRIVRCDNADSPGIQTGHFHFQRAK